MDWAELHLAAIRARAAYESTESASRAAFMSMGDTFIAQTSNMTYQAALSVDKAGNTFLSISGTRLPGMGVKDLWDDIRSGSVQTVGGSVSAGALDGMHDLWEWVGSILGNEYKLSVSGHSLGAVRAHMTPIFANSDKIDTIYSFEAPKLISQEFYDYHSAYLSKMKCVLNGGDIWASYKWGRNNRPNCPHIWLKGNAEFEIIDAKEWPGGLSMPDHSIDLVVSRLSHLASS